MKPTIALIYVPYDSGKAGERCGRAPLRAAAAGIAGRLRQLGDVREHIIMHAGGYTTEGATAFDLARQLSRAVAQARDEGAFPLILAGDCVASVGALSGMGGTRPGVVWLDAHADYNTADSSETGFLGGMPVAILTGDTYRAAAATVPGFQPLNKDRLIFLGVRDVDPLEQERVTRDQIPTFPALTMRHDDKPVLAALDRLKQASDAVYVHLDMDVLDPVPLAASEYECPDGIRYDDLGPLLTTIAGRVPMMAATITAFDPSRDIEGVMLRRYLDTIAHLAALGVQ